MISGYVKNHDFTPKKSFFPILGGASPPWIRHWAQEMLPLIFMGVEMLLLDNSVLKNYLLNTQLSFHIVI
jgi:hypothetical protein